LCFFTSSLYQPEPIQRCGPYGVDFSSPPALLNLGRLGTPFLFN
jgi:hypothetical protein